MKSRCIDLLLAEHKIILRTVDVLSAIAKEATDRKQLHREDIRGILEIFRIFADEFHQGKEESALFPVFAAVCERSEIDSIRHMLFEHDQDRSLIEGMEDALLRSNAADFAEYAAHLREFLRTHIYKEDNILFELVDKGLSPEDDKRVIEGFEAFDQELAARGRDKLLHRLHMLEWKYRKRPANTVLINHAITD